MHPIRPQLVIATLVLAVGVSSSAAGLTMSPNPLDVAVGPFDFELLLTTDAIGLPAGGVVLDGSVGASDTTLVFSLAQGTSLNTLPDFDWEYTGSSPVMPVMTGIGTIPGPDADITFGGLTAGGLAGQIGFALGFEETLDPFFVSFSTSPESAEIVFGTLSGFVDFASVTIVPEPSVGLLVPAALFGVTASGRRRLQRQRDS